MSTPLVFEGTLPRRGRRGAAQATTVSEPSSRVPRIARLVALAWHIEEQVRLGTLASYAAAAQRGRRSCSHHARGEPGCWRFRGYRDRHG